MADSQNTIPIGGSAKTTPTNMLTADLLVTDELITFPASRNFAQISENERDRYARIDVLLGQLLGKRGMERGGKISIDAEEFKELSSLVAGVPGKMEAGGATADMVTTIKNLRGHQVNIDFLGVSGLHGINDNLITEDLHKNGISLDPGATADARAAMSYIFTYPDGKRSIVTYPGNAAEKLHADMVTDARVAKSDTVLLPISLWSKFDSSLPETLLRKSMEQDKQIILTIPKQARFGNVGSEYLHKRVIPNADVIVADEDELAQWYKTGSDYELAITQLQADIALRDTLRTAAGKPPRSKPATAFIKHKDDSATILVAPSPPGIAPATPAARYEIPSPPSISDNKHTLGVDDAMYAGFIAALDNGLPPQKAGQFAIDVASTKFLYDSVRIPSPAIADTVTQERWNGLRSGLDDALAGVESAIGYARTGISNPVDTNVQRTPGQKAFDLGLYPLLANVGVFALSAFVTYHSNFNQNKANWFVKRSSWFKDQLIKVPALAENPKTAADLNMVIWSFIDGSLMSPVVAAFESKRQKISRWLDDKMGTAPEDKTVYDKEVQRSWQDVIKARAATFAFVIGTYFTLKAKVFPNSLQEGILAETAAGSGIFKRNPVKSINGMVFDVPARKIGGWLHGIPSIRNWAQKISGSQLKGMAEKTGAVARAATETDARYQIEGMADTGLFELIYTSLCTAGLFILGKTFASKRNHQEAIHDTIAPGADAASNPVATTNDQQETSSWTKKIAAHPMPGQSNDYLDAIDKSRHGTLQIGA